jgi:hypothetical protein
MHPEVYEASGSMLAAVEVIALSADRRREIHGLVN